MALKGRSSLTTKLTISFTNIKNPYAVRDTSNFNIEVYKKYDSGSNVLS